MSRTAALSLLALLTLCAAPALGAGGSLEQISHRDKLYDIARHGDTLFAVGYPGLLLRSTDRGGSWSLVEVETDDALFAMDIAADGNGMALIRKFHADYGNDPENWTAEDASPGE